jgi:pilus assembly protein CpaF
MVSTEEQPFGLGDYPQNREAGATPSLLQIKGELHKRLIDRVEEVGADFAELRRSAVRHFVAVELERVLRERPFALSQREIESLTDDLTNELTGYGPLESILRDGKVEDILVNGPREIYVGRSGRLQLTEHAFQDDAHLMRIIGRLLALSGRRVDESTPTVDARLADIGRINVIIPPLSLNGPVLSIRRFPSSPLQASDLTEKGTLTEPMLEFLRLAVEQRCNILVSGGTSSGKTTFLNILAGFIPPAERVITIEDTAELQLQSRHVVRLESRPGGHDGQGAVDVRDLLRNTLRMRPDRIVVGEVRGGEALEMLQAMTTGHDGSLGTIHANSAREALQRLEILLSFGGFRGTEMTMRRQIASAVDIIVQIGRLPDGRRRVLSISEVTGMGDAMIAMQEHFRLDLQDNRDGESQERWVATGVAPRNPKLSRYRPSTSGDDFSW